MGIWYAMVNGICANSTGGKRPQEQWSTAGLSRGADRASTLATEHMRNPPATSRVVFTGESSLHPSSFRPPSLVHEVGANGWSSSCPVSPVNEESRSSPETASFSDTRLLSPGS